MIQSMEILQLPILALEERIEQEMQENPILEMREEDPDLPAEPVEAEAPPDAPSEEERELVIDETANNEKDFERLLEMDQQFPDRFEERSRPSRDRIEEDGERRHDAMANMAERPQSLQDYLHDQLAWFELDPAAPRHGRPDHLQPGPQRPAPVQPGRRRSGPAPPKRTWPWPGRPWPWSKSSIRPASAPATCGSVSSCN